MRSCCIHTHTRVYISFVFGQVTSARLPSTPSAQFMTEKCLKELKEKEVSNGIVLHVSIRQHTSAYVSIRRMSGCTPMAEKCLEELKEKFQGILST